MKTIVRQFEKRRAFTIVELLTVMSIIVILIGLLVPALNKVRIYAKEVTQNAQFHSIEAALELFNNAFDGYPDSAAVDSSGSMYLYCGAMKLCEAMMGQDMLGFHSNSVFRADGRDAAGATLLYDPTADLTARKGPYLPPESADAVEVGEIWPTKVTATTPSAGAFMARSRVLCDVYTRRLDSGRKAGMPVLYYKADTTGKGRFHDPSRAATMTPTDNRGNIYNFLDNQDLIDLGMPGAAAAGMPYVPKMDFNRFYKNTLSDKVTTVDRPFRADTYILISAGYDAEYGTADDIMNFKWDYKELVP